jgi:hypothetical protein
MADNPESEGTTEEAEQVEQDDSVESAAQAILDTEETEEESDGEVEGEEESEPQHYTVKVDGKEVDVSLDELTSGYLKQSDYTKKTSELADQRKAVIQQAEAIQQERNHYAQALGGMKTEQENQLEEYKQIDWNQLREADSLLFMQRRDEMRDLEKSIEDKHKEQQALGVQAQRYQANKFNHDVEQGRQHLLAIMPDWNDKTSKDVREFGLGQGFSSDELSGITDHRSMAVLRKAMMYDAIQKAQPAKKKVKADTPKYVKSGVSKSKSDISAKARSDKSKRLRKSGSVDDAASMIYDIL